MKKLIKDDFMNKEYKFDSFDEAHEETKKEAIVCGDVVRMNDNFIEIYNHHQQGVRWKGTF